MYFSLDAVLLYVLVVLSKQRGTLRPVHDSISFPFVIDYLAILHFSYTVTKKQKPFLIIMMILIKDLAFFSYFALFLLSL